MTVAIATLCEALPAQGAGEGPVTLVGSYMVLHIAELRKLLPTCQALEDLVLAARLGIQILDLPEALRFANSILCELVCRSLFLARLRL